jgi:flavin-binding protein dodecin
MPDVARVTTITAASEKSFQDAIEKGLERANRTIRNVTGAEITEQKVKVDHGKVVEYRATMNVIFILEG